MVEIVARALARQQLVEVLQTGTMAASGLRNIELASAAVDAEDELWPSRVTEARLVIEAMREPTQSMITAALEQALKTEVIDQGDESEDYLAVLADEAPVILWHAMIDGALS